ncbi:hypothetical protein ACFLVG_00645 [Chloroflexota bacterium]
MRPEQEIRQQLNHVATLNEIRSMSQPIKIKKVRPEEWAKMKDSIAEPDPRYEALFHNGVWIGRQQALAWVLAEIDNMDDIW